MTMQAYKTASDAPEDDGNKQPNRYETPKIHTGPDGRDYLIVRQSLADAPPEGMQLAKIRLVERKF